MSRARYHSFGNFSDFSYQESIEKAIAEVTSKVGTLGLRALINNAGVSLTGKQ